MQVSKPLEIFGVSELSNSPWSLNRQKSIKSLKTSSEMPTLSKINLASFLAHFRYQICFGWKGFFDHSFIDFFTFEQKLKTNEI
jgi:hypothetical protein